MSRRWARIAALALILLPTLNACTAEPELRVLLIGNSYTTSNNLPAMMSELARAGGHRLRIEVRAPGGWWWRDHAASPQTMEAIADGDFDVVVFQEQSMVTSVPNMARRESRPAAVALANAATLTGARIVMYTTWGHRNGSAEVGHGSYESMQGSIINTYQELSAAVGGTAAPVGTAWWMTRKHHGTVNLYHPDGSHPSPAGSYLAAVVLTATILGVEPLTLDSNLEIEGALAGALRQVAQRVIVNGEVPW